MKQLVWCWHAGWLDATLEQFDEARQHNVLHSVLRADDRWDSLQASARYTPASLFWHDSGQSIKCGYQEMCLVSTDFVQDPISTNAPSRIYHWVCKLQFGVVGDIGVIMQTIFHSRCLSICCVSYAHLCLTRVLPFRQTCDVYV